MYYLFIQIAVVYINHERERSTFKTMLLLVSILPEAFLLCEFTVAVNKRLQLFRPHQGSEFPVNRCTDGSLCLNKQTI